MEGKAAGLGAYQRCSRDILGKDKGRSMEGTLVRVTKHLAVSFIVIGGHPTRHIQVLTTKHSCMQTGVPIFGSGPEDVKLPAA